jgi:uncharacterized membrane protein YbhN (UPF0104 family)
MVKRRILVAGLKYGLGLGLLAWVVWSHWAPADGTPGLADALQRDIHFTPLLLAGVICLASVLLTFVRWFVLVRALGLPFTLGGALRLGLIGYALNTFLPGSVGGDIIKAAFIAREQDRRTVAVATVLIDRLIGLVGLFWLAALLGGLFWATGTLLDLTAGGGAAVLETIVCGAWLLTGSSLLGWLLLGLLPSRRAEIFAGRLTRIPKVGGSLAELWRAVWLYRCRGRGVGLALLLALVGHVGFVLTFYFAALTLSPADAVPSLATHFLVVPVGMTIQAGFPAPGGVGGGEYGFGKLYDLVGFTFAAGVLASLVRRVIEWVLGLVGYLVYLRLRPSLPPAELAEPAGLAVVEA